MIFRHQDTEDTEERKLRMKESELRMRKAQPTI
jgi:hypothetical protein